jgi:hypothetical protein
MASPLMHFLSWNYKPKSIWRDVEVEKKVGGSCVSNYKLPDLPTSEAESKGKNLAPIRSQGDRLLPEKNFPGWMLERTRRSNF